MTPKCKYPQCFEKYSSVKYVDNYTPYCELHYEKLRRANIPLKDLLVEVRAGKREFLTK